MVQQQETTFAAYKQKAERRIVAKSLEVLKLRQERQKLAQRQEAHRNFKRNELSLSKWRSQYEILKRPEAGLRPCDRKFDVRMYSRMDSDLWQKGELRAWFERGATATIESRDPDYNGYMIRYDK